MLSDIKQDINDLQSRLQEYTSYIDFEGIAVEIANLEEKTSEPDFWNDQASANRVIKKINILKKRVDPWKEFIQDLDDLTTMCDLADEENSSDYDAEIQASCEDLKQRFDKLELLEVLSGENDSCNAIVNIHPGAGGTEACDWASMLYRMYTRWAENRGFKHEILDWLDGDEAGIKNVTFLIKGDYSFGYLKFESGIHRLVRISPFDSNARRHTSFASIYVTPDIEDDIELDIAPADLRIDTYRAGGAGGQHVNKTDSAVRITHLPTGIVVQCQNERSQHKNKASAMKVLKARLFDHYLKEQEKEKEKENPEKKEIAWGSQIRSYVFQPYTMVKDHRTKCEIGNVQSVMDGAIDMFLDEELKVLGMNRKK
jgi:peptide chain release factor 2